MRVAFAITTFLLAVFLFAAGVYLAYGWATDAEGAAHMGLSIAANFIGAGAIFWYLTKPALTEKAAAVATSKFIAPVPIPRSKYLPSIRR